MDGSTGIWMGLTLAAPLTLVPEIALLRLMHSRRAAWHPLDVLLVALLVGQLCCTLVTLGLSAAALARNAGLLPGLGSDGSPRILEGESAATGRPLVALELLHHHRTPLCAALISFWAAAHTLHAATLTSMAVDRAMTIRWSYKYRVSVRRTQIRYHVVVLAVVSLLVGVATLFASGIGTSSTSAVSSFRQAPIQPAAVLTPSASNDSAIIAEASVMAMELENCSFLPYTFDSRFSLFWLCLHGVLFLTTLTAGAVIFVTRVMIRCSRGFSGRLGLAGGSGSDMRTLGNASDGSSATLPLPNSSSSSLPTLPAPPPPRYTPGPVACLSAGSLGHHQHAGTAKVSPTPQLTRSSHPNFMFGSTDKTFMNLLHHHESGLAGNHHKTGTADFSAAAVAADGGSGCCGGGGWNRQRHSTVAAVLIVAYFTHHLPLLVLTTLGTFFADILPSAWPFSALVLGLSLFSGLLFMAVLVFIDPVLYAWMVDSLRPGSRRIAGADRHRHLNHHHHHRSPVTSESATLEPNLIAPMKIDDDTRYRMSQIYSQEPTEAKFPLTNGSLFVHLMNPSSGDGKRGNRRPSRMGVSAYDHRPAQQQRGSAAIMGSQSHIAEAVYPEATKPPLMTFMSRARILSMTSSIDSYQSQCANVDTSTSRHQQHHHQSQQSQQSQSIEPFYNDPMSSIGAPPSFADAEEQVAADVLLPPVHHAPHVTASSSTSTLHHSKFKSHEPIYASLSETLSSSHTLESVEGPASLLDEFAPNLRRQREIDDDDEQEEEEEEDEGSATESAGDDFEFHNIRTSRQTLITPPNDVATSAASTEVVFGLEDLRPRSRVARSATYRILCNGLDVKCAGKHDVAAAAADTREVLAATSESRHGIVTCVTIQIGPKEQQQQTAFGESSSSLRRSKLLTSLSMNDIDVLGESQEDELSSGLDYSDVKLDGCVRSDSLFSLYTDGSDPLQSSPESSLSSPFKENPSLICSAFELSSSNQTTKNESSPVRRSPFRQQQHQQHQQQQQPMVNLRKKSSHRSRAAVLKRFQEREMSWPSQGNGIQPLKTGSVVSMAALKAALTQSPTSHYLDNGELYFPQRLQQQQQQQSKTVFVSDYI